MNGLDSGANKKRKAEKMKRFKLLLFLALISTSVMAQGWNYTPSGGGVSTAQLHDSLNTLSTVRNVKIYRALLTQSGTDAPVATVLENSLGGTIVLSYSNAGEYDLTLAGAFPAGKCFPSVLGAVSNDDPSNLTTTQIYRVSDNVIRVRMIDPGETPANLHDFGIQILVYP